MARKPIEPTFWLRVSVDPGGEPIRKLEEEQLRNVDSMGAALRLASFLVEAVDDVIDVTVRKVMRA